MPALTQLARLMTRPDPLLTWRWVTGAVPFGAEYGVDTSYVETFEIPFNNVKTEGVFCAGGYNYFPGFHDVSAFNVTFYGDSKGNALKYIMGWKSKVKSFETGIYALPPEFKRNWHVSLLDPAGEIVITVALEGCWPADTGQISLAYEDGGSRITFNQNFSVDTCKVL